MNLLKTISLKLNEVTVQFFFQQLPGGTASFPLYTGARMDCGSWVEALGNKCLTSANLAELLDDFRRAFRCSA